MRNTPRQIQAIIAIVEYTNYTNKYIYLTYIDIKMHSAPSTTLNY